MAKTRRMPPTLRGCARYEALKKEIGGTPVEQLEHMPYGGGKKPEVSKGGKKRKKKNANP